MRLATWNVNGLRARLDFVRHWLRARRPDVVGLQEIKLTDEQFPHAELEELGYRAAVHGQKGWNGVAVLSRVPAEVVQRGLPGQDDRGARLLTVQIGELTFTTVYVPNGKHVEHEDFPKKLAWLDALTEHLETGKGKGRARLLCGDMNVCPAALDTWNEEELAGRIHHTEKERERFRALLGCGFRDLFRDRYPDERRFSWWDYRGGAFHRGRGLRIDFLLGSDELASRLRAIEIDRDYRKKKEGLIPSDHAPVIAELRDLPVTID